MLIFGLTTMPYQQHAPYQGLYAWGTSGTYYNLGQLDSTTVSNSPVMVVNETPVSWRSIATGGIANANGAFSAAVDEKYRLWTWGNRDQYQGFTNTTPIAGITYSSLNSPTQFTSAELANYSWKAISVQDGYNPQLQGLYISSTMIAANIFSEAKVSTYILAIRSDGRLFSWGNNPYFTLGQGAVIRNRKPTEVTGGGSWNSVFAGWCGAAGIKSDGRLYRWGYAAGCGPSAAGYTGDVQYSVPTLATTGTNAAYHARYVSTGIGTSSPVFASALSYTHVAVKQQVYGPQGSVYVTGPYLNTARTDYTRTVFHSGTYTGGVFGNYTANQLTVTTPTATVYTTLERVQSDSYNIPDSDPANPTFAGPAMNTLQNYYFVCMGKLYGMGAGSVIGDSPVISYFGTASGDRQYPSQIPNFPTSSVSAVSVAVVYSSPMVVGNDGFVYTSALIAYRTYGKSMYSWHAIGTSSDIAGKSWASQGGSLVGSIIMATAPWGASNGRSAVGIVKGTMGNRALIKMDDNTIWSFTPPGASNAALDGDVGGTYYTNAPGSVGNPFKVGSFIQVQASIGNVTLPTGSFGGKFFQEASNGVINLGDANFFYIAANKIYGCGAQNGMIETAKSLTTGSAALNYDYSATGNMYLYPSSSFTMVSAGANGLAAITTNYRLREWGTVPAGTGGSLSTGSAINSISDGYLSPNLVISVSMGNDHAAALVAPGSTAADIIRLTGSKTDATSTIAMADTTGVAVGQRIYGDGVPEQTFVKTVTTNTSIAVTNNLVGTDPTVNLTFVPGVTSIYHWGNVFGAGTTNSPVVAAAGSWIFVDAGYKTTAGISASTTLPAGTGRLFMWGQNNNYQLGNGTNVAKLSVGTALGTSTWRKVSIAKISPTNVLGILNNYNLRSWGYHGQTDLATGIAPTVVNLAFDTTSASSSIYGGSVTGLVVGMSVSGTGIQAGTVINSIDSVNFIVVLSLPATATNSGISLQFTGGVTSTTMHVSTPTALGGEYWKDVKATGYGGYGIQTSAQGAQKGTLWSWGSDNYYVLGTEMSGTGARVYELPDLANGKAGAQVGQIVYNRVTKNYYLADGSSAISTADTSGIVAGQNVVGTGIPSGTSVASVVDSTSITLSANATYTGLASGLSFFQLGGSAFTPRSNWTLVGGGVTARTAASEIVYS